MGFPPLPPILQHQLDLPPDSREVTTPHFVNLYRYLGTSVLDAEDLSTKSEQRDQERGVLYERLRGLWVERARRAVLVRALREVCGSCGWEVGGRKGGEDVDLVAGLMGEEMRELWFVVAEYLANVDADGVGLEVREEIGRLMDEELEQFGDTLPLLSEVLGKHVQELEETLCKMAKQLMGSSTRPIVAGNETLVSRIPKASSYRSTASSMATLASQKTTNPSESIKSLPPTSTSTTTSSSSTLHTFNLHLATLHHQLSILLTKTTSLLSHLLTLLSSTLTSQIHHLEVHTHSTGSRHQTSHATFLATVAQGIELKTKILALLQEKEVYATGVSKPSSPSSTSSTLKTGLGRGIGGGRGREEKETGMAEHLAERYAEMEEELARLEGREERLLGLLAEYDRVGVGEDGGRGGREVMKELGRGYGGVEEEIEAVRGDLRRLEDGV